MVPRRVKGCHERPELRSRDCAKHRASAAPGPVTLRCIRLRLLDLTHERNAKKLTAENDAGQLNAL